MYNTYFMLIYTTHIYRGCHGRDCMAVRFTTTYAIPNDGEVEMESSQWENLNHLFCRKVSFLNAPQFPGVGQGMRQTYLYLWPLCCLSCFDLRIRVIHLVTSNSSCFLRNIFKCLALFLQCRWKRILYKTYNCCPCLYA